MHRGLAQHTRGPRQGVELALPTVHLQSRQTDKGKGTLGGRMGVEGNGSGRTHGIASRLENGQGLMGRRALMSGSGPVVVSERGMVIPYDRRRCAAWRWPPSPPPHTQHAPRGPRCLNHITHKAEHRADRRETWRLERRRQSWRQSGRQEGIAHFTILLPSRGM